MKYTMKEKVSHSLLSKLLYDESINNLYTDEYEVLGTILIQHQD